MSLRLFFVRRSHTILLLACVGAFSSCARKNTRVYNFCLARQPQALRVDLPYLARVQGTYDAVQHQCNLTWEPISIAGVPDGLSLHGYNLYVGTTLKLFGRLPLLRLPAQTHACEFVMQQPFSTSQLFGIAPVFHDQQKNEIVGLVTVAKFL